MNWRARRAPARRRARASARRAFSSSVGSSSRRDGRSGPFEVRDEPVERGDVAPAAPSHFRFAHRPRGGAGACGIRGVREMAQRQGSRGEAFAQAIGGKSIGDPFEEGEGPLARIRVSHGDPAGKRALDAVLPRQLPRERRVHRCVRVEDLDLVEGNPLGEDAAECLPDLVFLADGPEELRLARLRRPVLGRVGRELEAARAGEAVEKAPLEGGQLEIRGLQIQRRRRRTGALDLLDGPTKDLDRVDGFPGRERFQVTAEDAADFHGLAPVGKRRRGDLVGRDPGGAQLLERLLEGPVEARPLAQSAEVGRGLERFRSRPARRARGPGRARAPSSRPARARAPTSACASVRTVSTRRLRYGCPSRPNRSTS